MSWCWTGHGDVRMPAITKEAVRWEPKGLDHCPCKTRKNKRGFGRFLGV